VIQRKKEVFSMTRWSEQKAEALRRKLAADKDTAGIEKKPEQARPEPFDHDYYRDDRVGSPGTIKVRIGGPPNQRIRDWDW